MLSAIVAKLAVPNNDAVTSVAMIDPTTVNGVTFGEPVMYNEPVMTAEPLYGNPAPDVFSAYDAVNEYDDDIATSDALTYDAVYASSATSAKR